MASERERPILRAILAEIGAEPDLYLMRNSTGFAEYVDDYGKSWKVPYGIGNAEGLGGPDFVGILDGHFFGLEVKAPDGVVSEEQKKCHELWRRFGAYVGVARSAQDARHHLTEARLFFRKRNGEAKAKARGKR